MVMLKRVVSVDINRGLFLLWSTVVILIGIISPGLNIWVTDWFLNTNWRLLLIRVKVSLKLEL